MRASWSGGEGQRKTNVRLETRQAGGECEALGTLHAPTSSSSGLE